MLHTSVDDPRTQERPVEDDLGRVEELLTPPPLSKFIENDNALFEAMEYFLLLNPGEQASRLGEPRELKAKADEARASGDNLGARIYYENAAKVGLYRQEEAEFKGMLKLAEQVTRKNERFAAFHRTLLSDSDGAMRVAREYYGELRELYDEKSGHVQIGRADRPGAPEQPTVAAATA